MGFPYQGSRPGAVPTQKGRISLISYAALVLAQADAGVSAGLLLAGIIAVVAGILILVIPRVLNYVVAIYLLASGVLLVIEAL